MTQARRATRPQTNTPPPEPAVVPKFHFPPPGSPYNGTPAENFFRALYETFCRPGQHGR